MDSWNLIFRFDFGRERERERDCLMCSWVDDWVPNIDNILCEKLNYENWNLKLLWER